MRLKSFSAPTMAQAMALVRRELGESAVIVSSTAATWDGHVLVTAAIERDDAGSAGATLPPQAPPGLAPGASVAAVVRALHDTARRSASSTACSIT